MDTQEDLSEGATGHYDTVEMDIKSGIVIDHNSQPQTEYHENIASADGYACVNRPTTITVENELYETAGQQVHEEGVEQHQEDGQDGSQGDVEPHPVGGHEGQEGPQGDVEPQPVGGHARGQEDHIGDIYATVVKAPTDPNEVEIVENDLYGQVN